MHNKVTTTAMVALFFFEFLNLIQLEASHLIIAVVVYHIVIRAESVRAKHTLDHTLIFVQQLQFSYLLKLICNCIFGFNEFQLGLFNLIFYN